MGKLTTHVLDTAKGRPAANVRIELFRCGGEDGWIHVADVRTNADGRIDHPILEGAALIAGRYELIFHVGDYFGPRPDAPADALAFLDEVPVRFGVDDPAAHYHVPLLISPFGYSTYRGS
ncbi:MAG: hydroxyisourate hydrolase [Neomegalonema sp.]|nr:hydroxyisourate hydrolase [Neomegalonema sp.]